MLNSEFINIYEELSELNEVLNDDYYKSFAKEADSEFARLMQTPEGRAKFSNLPRKEQNALQKAHRVACYEKQGDQVMKILTEIETIPLEYDGFENDWYEDHFDPNSSYGHYQTGGTNSYGSFTYEADAVTVFEYLRDSLLPEQAGKKSNSLLAEFKRLNDICDSIDYKTQADAFEKAGEELEIFIVQNLDEFVDMFMEDILDYFAEGAQEWALDNLDPNDYFDDEY